MDGSFCFIDYILRLVPKLQSFCIIGFKALCLCLFSSLCILKAMMGYEHVIPDICSSRIMEKSSREIFQENICITALHTMYLGNTSNQRISLQMFTFSVWNDNNNDLKICREGLKFYQGTIPLRIKLFCLGGSCLCW